MLDVGAVEAGCIAVTIVGWVETVGATDLAEGAHIFEWAIKRSFIN